MSGRLGQILARKGWRRCRYCGTHLSGNPCRSCHAWIASPESKQPKRERPAPVAICCRKPKVKHGICTRCGASFGA